MLESSSLLSIPASLFERQESRQDASVVVDNTVGNQTAALIPDLSPTVHPEGCSYSVLKRNFPKLAYDTARRSWW